MPNLSDPLGPPKIVTGPEYMDALARLGYNVENMSSPLPIMAKIASAGTNFLDSIYNQNMRTQQAQADLQYSVARTKNLDAETQYNEQSLDLRLKALDQENKQRELQNLFNERTLDSRVQSTSLATQQAQANLDHDKNLFPLQEQELQQKNRLTKIEGDAAERDYGQSSQALDQWEQAYPSYPSITDPDYTTKRAKWMDDNRMVLTNRMTAQKAQELISKSDAAYGTLSASQVKQAEVQRFSDFQKNHLISPLYNADTVAHTDQGQDLMVRANLAQLSNDLGTAIGTLPTGITGPMGQQIESLRSQLIGQREQVNAYAGSDDEVGNIRKGANVNVAPSGLARGDLQGSLTRAKVLNDELMKRGLVEQKETVKLPTAKPVQGARTQPEVEISGPPGTAAYVASHPWEYSPVFRSGSTVPYYQEEEQKKIFRGLPAGEAGRPTPEAPKLPPEEQTFRNQRASAVLGADPSKDTRELVNDYLAGRITRSGFDEQLRTKWAGGRPPGAQRGSSDLLAQAEVVNDPIFQQMRADAISGADPLPGNVRPGTPQGDQALWEKYVAEKQAKGQKVPGAKMQTGGLVGGKQGTDQVPAMLTSGEYVVNKDAVQDIGLPMLEALNQGQTPVTDGKVGAGTPPSQWPRLASIKPPQIGPATPVTSPSTRQTEQPTTQTAQTTQTPGAEPVNTPAVTTGPATTGLTGTGGTTLTPKYTAGDALLNAHYLGDGRLSGLATNFGHDVNGRPDTYMLSKLGGGSRLGAFGTDVVNPNTAGASIPVQTFRAFIGNPSDPQVRQRVQSGRVGVEVWAPNGRSARFPIVDLGPGKGENASLDLTGSAMRQLGMSDNFGAVYRIYSQ
jgi:hypothetical protein